MGWGNGNMMNWGQGAGFFGILVSIFWVVVLVDLVLLGVWLWKKIEKK